METRPLLRGPPTKRPQAHLCSLAVFNEVTLLKRVGNGVATPAPAVFFLKGGYAPPAKLSCRFEARDRLDPLGVKNVVKSGHAVLLVHGTGADTAELLHVTADTEEETKVDCSVAQVVVADLRSSGDRRFGIDGLCMETRPLLRGPPTKRPQAHL